jgi:hypothetical protein
MLSRAMWKRAKLRESENGAIWVGIKEAAAGGLEANIA